MPRIITEWSTDDPDLAKMLTMINRESDPALKLDLEAMLHHQLALISTRDAERLRTLRSRRTGRRS
jgi:hypothetical protein